jgi:hypothetical protein
MYILTDYTFSPGEAGVGTISIPGNLSLENFGVIVNVTRGSILYSPTEGQAGATLSREGGLTILTLEQGTTYCDPDDDLQIIAYSTSSSGGGGGGGGTDGDLSQIEDSTSSIDNKLPALSSGRIPVDVGGAVINITGNVEVSSEVEVKNTVGSPIPVSDAGGSLTVDGPLTNTELRAAAVPVSASSLPLPSGAATEAKQNTLIGHVDGIEGILTTITESGLPTITGLSIPEHDNIQLSYTGENLTGVTYRVGATTVATLTLSYTGSRLDSVTRS